MTSMAIEEASTPHVSAEENHRCPARNAAHYWGCGKGEPCPDHPEKLICPEHEEDMFAGRQYRTAPSSYQGPPDDEAGEGRSLRMRRTETKTTTVEVRERRVRLGGRKLGAEQVAEIRKSYATGKVLQRDLAKKYGVSGTTVSLCLTGDTYPDADGPIYRPRQSGPPVYLPEGTKPESVFAKLRREVAEAPENPTPVALAIREPVAPVPAHLVRPVTPERLETEREDLLAQLAHVDRALLAMKVIGATPGHYVQIAEAVVSEATMDEPCEVREVSRRKAVAAIAALLFWDDAFTDEPNSVLEQNRVLHDDHDPEGTSHDLLSDAAEAIFGKPAERSWITPRPKKADA